MLKCGALWVAEDNILNVQMGRVVVEEIGPVAFILRPVCVEIA